jgi:hypothetical protein
MKANAKVNAKAEAKQTQREWNFAAAQIRTDTDSLKYSLLKNALELISRYWSHERAHEHFGKKENIFIYIYIVGNDVLNLKVLCFAEKKLYWTACFLSDNFPTLITYKI